MTDHLTFGLRKESKLHAVQRKQKMFHGINHHTDGNNPTYLGYICSPAKQTIG
jgi:hypothetical protein